MMLTTPTSRNLELEPEFILLTGAARSGTTLARLLLDAHPAIGCPAEAGIPSLILNLGRVWWTIDAGHVRDGRADPQALSQGRAQLLPGNDQAGPEGLLELPATAKNEIRRSALAPMRHYCERHGKRIYCDKSLDSVHHLRAVGQIFPEARYLLLFRHVMDTVASGIEASPWGFQAYGYFPFVQRSPDNFVAALVSYWLDHVDPALRWEEAHPDLCHRIRYEDLVTVPEKTVARLFAFLGVDRDLSVLRTAFEKARTASGPGDYKVIFTSRVDTASIGHGKRVPVGMIPPPLLEAVNEKLTVLGYEPLTKAWNTEPLARSDDGGPWGARLANLMRSVQLQPFDGRDDPVGSFAVVAEDVAELRWVIDRVAGMVKQGDGEVESVITGTAEDLALLVGGEVNPGVLLRSGRIRHLTPHDDVSPEELAQAMRSILELLKDGCVRGNGFKTVAAVR